MELETGIDAFARVLNLAPDTQMKDFELTVHHAIEDLPVNALDLFDGDEDGDIFSSLPWYRNFAETVLADDDDFQIQVLSPCTSPQNPVLILPMRQMQSTGLLPLRALQPLANFYTSLFNVIPAGDSAAAEQHVVNWVRALSAQRPRFDQISLFPLSTDSSLYKVGSAAFANAGYIVQRYFCFGNWYLKVAGRSYAEYFDALPSTLQNTISRKSRQLDTMPGMRLAILRLPNQAAEGARVFDRVVRRSWKNPEPFPHFVPGLIRTCAEQGWLRMGVAYLHDEPIAFQIWFVHRKIASVYKLAYDEDHAKLSVGTVLTAMLMRRVIDDDRVVEVDYLHGDERYKEDWMSDRRERYGMIAFDPRTFRGAIGAGWNLLGRVIRQFIPAKSTD